MIIKSPLDCNSPRNTFRKIELKLPQREYYTRDILFGCGFGERSITIKLSNDRV
jgi:hypothetical protein